MKPFALVALAILTLTFAPAPPAIADAPAADPIVIGVIDTGINPDHAEFDPGQVVAWKDYVNGGSSPYDDQGHGTAVASLVAGRTIGTYPGAKLAVAKVLNSNNALPTWGPLALAIRWAINTGGADVISISIWGTGPQQSNSELLAGAIDYAYSQNVLVVWIAGNGGHFTSFNGVQVPWPVTADLLVGSSSPKALVVGAANQDGSRAGFSQLDPEVLAWGANTPLACPSWSHCYTTGSGTSYAAPKVAGYAARLLAEGAPKDPDWLKWVLLHSARDNPDVLYLHEGYGFLDDAAFDGALAVARGESPMPGADERDAFHVVSEGVRVAITRTTPAGALPP